MEHGELELGGEGADAVEERQHIKHVHLTAFHSAQQHAIHLL